MCDTLGRVVNEGLALFAKNSDRSPNEPQVIEYRPARDHREKELRATYLTIEQAPHTYATLLSASGAAPKTIQAILGHADISTTMNRYVHQDAGLIHQAAETVSQAIVRAR